MEIGVRTEGLSKVLNNLNKAIEKKGKATAAGLFAGGLFIQRESQKRVPVEYGNLRGSAYTRKARDNTLAVEIGYGAAYALYVHENMEQKLKGKPRPSGLGVYWGPHGEPKFLENVLKEKKADILRTIAAYSSR